MLLYTTIREEVNREAEADVFWTQPPAHDDHFFWAFPWSISHLAHLCAPKMARWLLDLSKHRQDWCRHHFRTLIDTHKLFLFFENVLYSDPFPV